MEIGEGAFCMCKSLKEIVLPNGINTIKRYAFAASGLETIILPNGLKIIETMGFYQCHYLNKAILPDTLTTIGDNAFAYCELLTNIVIPKSIVKIGNSAFFKSVKNSSTLSKLTISSDLFIIYLAGWFS